MKKIVLVFVCVLFVLFVSCNGGESKSDKKTIGVVMINFTNPFYSSSMEAMKEAADKLGYELVIKSAEGKLETEISIIENYIQQGVACIMVDAIDKEGVIDIFDKASEAGIPVISLYNIVNEGGSNFNIPYDHFSGFKGVTLSVFEKLGGKGNVLLLSGQKGNYANDERERAFYEVLDNYPNITLLANQPTDWDPSKGLSIVETWLTTYDDIGAILSVSDGITPSVVEAVYAAERDDEIIVAGNDGEMDVLEIMKTDKIVVADALLGSKRGGYLAVLYADKIINDANFKKVEPVTTYLVINEDLKQSLSDDDIDTSWIEILTPEEAMKAADNYVEEYLNY